MDNNKTQKQTVSFVPLSSHVHSKAAFVPCTIMYTSVRAGAKAVSCTNSQEKTAHHRANTLPQIGKPTQAHTSIWLCSTFKSVAEPQNGLAVVANFVICSFE